MYEKIWISQKKLQKISRKELNNYVNLETWEVLDILMTKKEIKNTYINLNYNFSMFNKEIDNIKLMKDIWPTYYAYLLVMVANIKTDNRVDYDLIDVDKPWKDKFKGILKKKWIVLWLRLDNMKRNEYFINPYLSSYWRTVSLELVKAFEKVNKEIYGINLLNNP